MFTIEIIICDRLATAIVKLHRIFNFLSFAYFLLYMECLLNDYAVFFIETETVTCL